MVEYILSLDSYVLKDPSGNAVTVSNKDIAWPGDIGFKFKRQSDASSKSWADVEDG